MGVAVGYAVAEAFGLTGPAWAVVILQSAMPVAVSNYLWAQLYGRQTPSGRAAHTRAQVLRRRLKAEYGME